MKKDEAITYLNITSVGKGSIFIIHCFNNL